MVLPLTAVCCPVSRSLLRLLSEVTKQTVVKGFGIITT